MDPNGNHYSLAYTDQGLPTFRHLSTGELLHGHVGPFIESRRLYTSLVQQEKEKDHVNVWDVGMGCGFQVLSLLEDWQNSLTPDHLNVLSFDLETQGLSVLLNHWSVFENLNSEGKRLVQNLIQCGKASTDHARRSFSWRLVEGDFRKTVLQHHPLAPDFIFYDFFSCQSHPHLWSYQLFSNVFNKCLPHTLLATYATATAVKAGLSAAGFWVGSGPQSGQKRATIQASPSMSRLADPLPRDWLQTFQRSGQPYLPTESQETRQVIAEKIHKSPQFSKTIT